ncbi:MAG: hypothetical protein ACLFTK_15425 [Anaerolineales bacterium]
MKRFILRLLIIAIASLALAACVESTPSDISGCIVEEGENPEDAYSEEFGCENDTVLYVYAHGADHSDEDAEHSEDENAEDAESDAEADE